MTRVLSPPKNRLRTTLAIAALLVAQTAQAESPVSQALRCFRHRLATAIGQEPNPFLEIQKKGYFLEQNADYLPKHLCGGTCVSVSYANNMLAMAEKLNPGSITRLSPAEIKKLHLSLMEETLGAIRATRGVDGTQGFYIAEFHDIYAPVYGRVFGKPLPKEVSVQSIHPGSLQSIGLGEDSYAVADVATSKTRGHAILITDVLPAVPHSPGHVPLEDFKFVVSDPHAPGDFKRLRVYVSVSEKSRPDELKNAYFLESYGQPWVFAPIKKNGAMGTSVQAGEIRGATVVNFKTYPARRTWGPAELKNMFPRGYAGEPVEVWLKNGTIYRTVRLKPHPTDPENHLYFRHRFGFEEGVRYSDIADIVPL